MSRVEGRCQDPGIAIALAGGGTGGHVVPGLHLLSHLRQRDALGGVLWFRTGRAAEERVLVGVDYMIRPATIRHDVLRLEPPGGGAPTTAELLRRTPRATWRSRRLLKEAGSQVVLGLGGFTCLPVVLGARLLALPVALLEINAVAGRATSALARLATRVFHAWPDTVPDEPGERHVLVGPPLAPAFVGGPTTEDASAAKRGELGFDPHRPLLVVLGGSQGAGALNDFVREAAPALIAAGVQIQHQVGPKRRDEGLAESADYRVLEFDKHVDRSLTAATVVLCRGGASTIAEVGALGRPAVVVPYPHSKDAHQEKNARRLGDGAVIVPESELGPDVAERLVKLCAPEAAEERRHRAAASAAAVPRDASARICDALLDLAQT